MIYTVYGNYGYTTETVLHHADTVEDAVRWVETYYPDGDLGPYDIIEVAYHAADGEYVVERVWRNNYD